MRKHGLAKHGIANGDAIQAAYQLIVDPRFNAVSKTCSMQCFVGRHHFVNDPRASLPCSGATCAMAYDFAEARIKPNLTAGISFEFQQGFAQRSVQLEF